jgi:hypothetical protein
MPEDRAPGESRPAAWQCPTCRRHIPRQIEVCRCGNERRRLEALGYGFERMHRDPGSPASKRRPRSLGLAASLVGYQLDTDVGARTRLALKTLLGISVAAVAVALVLFTHTDPLPIRDNIQILTALESFTRQAQPDSSNTIPSFLASAGRLGVLPGTGAPRDPVRSIQESDLQQGLCSQSVARQVRHEYPGFYDKWPDDKLEHEFLQKYPQYADRVCVLSVRFDATASDIIKYELKPRSLLAHAFIWLRTLTLTAMFALVCLNAYYRLFIARIVSPLDAAA